MLSLTSLLVAASLLLTTSASPVQVSIGQTTLVGDYDTSAGVDAFLGVRYATAKRFERPSLVTYSTTQTLNASVHAPACAQINNATGYTTYGVTEQCNFLEIYRPHNITTKLPVLVWIHGGGGNYGAANTYLAYNFVKQSQAIQLPVIVVTVNYRLAAWGWIGGKEAAANKALNLGLYDQRAALQWVQKYIGNFGGDYTKVTLWGHSSGAMSIHHHFLTTNTNLFRGAIMQSGTVASVPALPPANFQSNYDALVAAVGCNTSSDTFACLKAVNFDTLQVAVNTLVANPAVYSTRPWGFVIDGEIIPDVPSKLVAAGKFAKKPFINGDVLDEGTLSPKPIPMDTEAALLGFYTRDYLNKGASWLSNQATVDQLFQLYPSDPTVGSPFNTGTETYGFGSQFKRGAALIGDIRYQGPRRNWFADATKYGVKGWSYQLSQFTTSSIPAGMGVYHSADLAYVFLQFPETSQYYPLAKQIHSYWVSFAYNLDPNFTGNPTWSPYGAGKNLLEFTSAQTSIIPDTFRDEAISFINSIPEQFGAPRS